MKWRSPRWTPIGVDVQGRHVKAVQLSGSAGRWCLEAAASVPRSDGTSPLGPGDVEHLAAVLERQGFRGREIVVAVPDDRVLTALVPMGPAGEGADGAVASAELAASHGCEAGALEVAWWDVPRPSRPRDERWALAVGCMSQEAEALLDVCESAGLRVVALDVSTCAVARACRPLLQDGGPAAVLDVGWLGADLGLVWSGGVIYRRALSELGMIRLRAALVQRYGIEQGAADHLIETLGLRPEPSAQPDLAEAVRSLAAGFVEKLAAELRVSLDYAAREFAAPSVPGLLLHGGGATMPGLDAALAAELGAETRSILPGDVVDVGSATRSGSRSPAFVTAVGLAQHPG